MKGNNSLTQTFSSLLLILITLILAVLVVQLPVQYIASGRFNLVSELLLGVIYLILFGIAIWAAKYCYQQVNHTTDNHISWKLTGKDWGLMLSGLVFYFIIQFGLGIANHWIYNQNTTANNLVIEKLLASNQVVLILMVVSTIFLSPILEELIFRGYFINAFFSTKNKWWGAFLSGILFSALHQHNLNLISFLVYASLGCVLSFVYLKSDKLVVAIGLHSLNNLIAVGVLVFSIYH